MELYGFWHCSAVTDVLPKLELARTEFLGQKSVDNLASLAKKGVEGSKPKANSSNCGQTYQRKLKKFTKKKLPKKGSTPSSGGAKTSTNQGLSGNITWIVSVLREGYNLEFKRDPPLTVIPSVISRYGDPAKKNTLGQEIFVLLDALEELRALLSGVPSH